jgi:succinate dehydrogenase/fumarate reductase-like Fe-S protein
MSDPRTVLLQVFRYRPSDPAPRSQEFRVPAGPRTTVLDALLAVRRHHDPGLTLRHSCLHGSCGTCGLRVNGREALACLTRLAGDLVVDMADFYQRLEPLRPPLVRARERAALGLQELGRLRTASSAACACRPARSPGIPASSGRPPWPPANA